MLSEVVFQKFFLENLYTAILAKLVTLTRKPESIFMMINQNIMYEH
jgi:hypothetical protein